jgi:hypothetical protein
VEWKEELRSVVVNKWVAITQHIVAGVAVLVAATLLVSQFSVQNASEISLAMGKARAAMDEEAILTAEMAGQPMEYLFAGRKSKATPLKIEDERRCLAQAIYFEARSEPFEGWVAVADVVLNRARDPRFPATICGVVFQGEYRRHRCQFSFACDGRSDKAYNRVQWERALRLASYKIANLSPKPTLTEATHYHADYVKPKWSLKMVKLDKIGRHIFYSDKIANN